MPTDLTPQLLSDTLSLFTRAFPSTQPIPPSSLIVASAPGRVNLIGEHTDYNDGYVMPMAIDRRTFVLGRRNESTPPVYRLVSQNISDEKDSHGHHKPLMAGAVNFTIAEFDAAALVAQSSTAQWHDYVRGVIAQYIKAGHVIPGFDAAVAGNVPLGGGLSSSASLEVATATFIDGLLGIVTDGVQKALMCQKAEHEYANVPCGIMDQFISALGQEKAAMLLDCRSQQPKLVSFVDPAVSILISNSNVKHALGSGEYAKRRAQCEEAVRALQKHHPAIASLRDTSLAQLQQAKADMSETAYQRARHVITECERTLAAATALGHNDYTAAGKLMTHSHVSLKDDYAVSCDELDCLVDIALTQRGVYGSRMTGGGFGGCTVTLVESARVAEVERAIRDKYRERTGKEATTMTSVPSQGALLHRL